VRTPGAQELLVDGVPARLVNGRLVLPLGVHSVVARAAGHRDASTTLHVNGGEDAELTLAPVAEPAHAAEELATPAEPPPSPRESGSAEPTAAIVLLAGGGGLLAASLATGLAWWLQVEQEYSACVNAPTGMVCANADEGRAALDAAMGTTLTLGVLGAGLSVIGAILLTDGDGDGAPAQALRCAPAGPGLVCGGSF
jgi:hypothetical protein